jgi:membrane protein required for colicin V production
MTSILYLICNLLFLPAQTGSSAPAANDIQAAAPEAQQAMTEAPAVLSEASQLIWVDYTALAILLIFVILGLFRGFLWQASRLVSLIVSFWLSGLYASRLAEYMELELGWFQGGYSLYVAYFAIFVACLIVLSLITMLLDRLLKDLKLKTFDYVGGGALGLLTGSAIVLALVSGTLAFASKDSSIFKTVHASETARWSHEIVERINPWLPEKLRQLLGTQDEEGSAPETTGPSESQDASAPQSSSETQKASETQKPSESQKR